MTSSLRVRPKAKDTDNCFVPFCWGLYGGMMMSATRSAGHGAATGKKDEAEGGADYGKTVDEFGFHRKC